MCFKVELILVEMGMLLVGEYPLIFLIAIFNLFTIKISEF